MICEDGKSQPIVRFPEKSLVLFARGLPSRSDGRSLCAVAQWSCGAGFRQVPQAFVKFAFKGQIAGTLGTVAATRGYC